MSQPITPPLTPKGSIPSPDYSQVPLSPVPSPTMAAIPAPTDHMSPLSLSSGGIIHGFRSPDDPVPNERRVVSISQRSAAPSHQNIPSDREKSIVAVVFAVCVVGALLVAAGTLIHNNAPDFFDKHIWTPQVAIGLAATITLLSLGILAYMNPEHRTKLLVAAIGIALIATMGILSDELKNTAFGQMVFSKDFAIGAFAAVSLLGLGLLCYKGSKKTTLAVMALVASVFIGMALGCAVKDNYDLFNKDISDLFTAKAACVFTAMLLPPWIVYMILNRKGFGYKEPQPPIQGPQRPPIQRCQPPGPFQTRHYALWGNPQPSASSRAQGPQHAQGTEPALAAAGTIADMSDAHSPSPTMGGLSGAILSENEARSSSLEPTIALPPNQSAQRHQEDGTDPFSDFSSDWISNNQGNQ